MAEHTGGSAAIHLRTLNDLELDQLIARAESRVAELTSRGVQMGGIAEHFTHCLLTALLTPEQEKLGREWHYLWLSDALDTAEEQIRKSLLMQGAPKSNGKR
jgi:hypothetical protein